MSRMRRLPHAKPLCSTQRSMRTDIGERGRVEDMAAGLTGFTDLAQSSSGQVGFSGPGTTSCFFNCISKQEQTTRKKHKSLFSEALFDICVGTNKANLKSTGLQAGSCQDPGVAVWVFWHLSTGQVFWPLQDIGLFLNSQGLFRKHTERLVLRKCARPVHSEDTDSQGRLVKFRFQFS